jgi:OTU domain-containing protein 5
VGQAKYQTPSSKAIAASSSVQKQQLPCTSAEQKIDEIVAECSSSDTSSLANSSCVNTSGEQVVDVIETVSGYNSGDEHLTSKDSNLTSEEWKKRDEKFSVELKKRGLMIKEMEEDGACLFRAISYQLYGDQEMHDIIRQQTCDYIYQNREYFAQFITEDITNYVNRKRQNHLHGNHIEIQAMSEMYNRPVELYCYEMTPM